MGADPSQQNQLDRNQQDNNQGQNSATGGESSDEVDVTEDIQNLLKYVAKKKEDDPHDGVLSRIHSRIKDIAESLTGGELGNETHNQPPTTPTVTIPDLPAFTFVRKRGGRIVKRPVKQEVPKT